MKLITNYWKPLLSLLFGVAVMVFWRGMYPSALAYHEQFQLFLWDDEYLISRISQPGGLARYMGEFLVQFYNLVTVGALILAVLYVLVQGITWYLCRKHEVHNNHAWYALSFIPSLLLWMIMGDENVMMSFVVAYVLQLVLLLFVPKGKKARWIFALLAIPTSYWCLGPIVFMLVLYLAAYEFIHNSSRWQTVCVALAEILLALASVLISANIVSYPLSQLFYGIDYYRIAGIFLYLLLVLEVVTVALPLGVRIFPNFEGKRVAWINIISAVALGMIAFVLKPMMYDSKKYDLIEYDYLSRLERWDAIISKSEKNMPDLPMSVSITNLALGMTNQLGDRVFDFYQNGGEGLLPRFERNSFTSLSASDIYYHLGMTNTAQRFAFEAQEGIPNFNKSARIMKRLAETNLINGQYGVALKYLQILDKTLFYKKWAERMMSLVADKKEINNHPEYGYLRQCHLQKDFLYSEAEVDKILGLLFVQNNANKLAMQYMAVYPLLEKNLQKLMLYLPFIENKILYNPRAIQEGVAMACMQQHQQPPQGFIDQITEQRFREFAQVFANQGKNSPQLDSFKNTYWYYMLVTK